MELPRYDDRRRRTTRLPPWLVKKWETSDAARLMKKDLRSHRLTTVCEEARCPNLTECWSRGTATLMVLGEICTRHCGFCSVASGLTGRHDPEEPEQAARMVKKMGLAHVVITMVARDDLPDGGAAHLAAVIGQVRKKNPVTKIEVLTSDFEGKESSLRTVLAASPDIFNHNVETVRRLTPRVRHRATYDRSLEVLRRAKEMNPAIPTKSGIMLGLGERDAEVEETLVDLQNAGCEILTIGQYLQPTVKNLPVVEFLPPSVFDRWGERAKEIGFRGVASGPFVRSSYHAEKLLALSPLRERETKNEIFSDG